MKTGRLALAVLFAAVALPAFAHHSGAMFDGEKTVTVTGVVKSYRWQNPHTALEVTLPGKAGPEEWSFEGSTPNILLRKGWSSKSFQSGDKVTVTMRPLRDGGHAGLILAVDTPSGAVLKDHDY